MLEQASVELPREIAIPVTIEHTFKNIRISRKQQK